MLPRVRRPDKTQHAELRTIRRDKGSQNVAVRQHLGCGCGSQDEEHRMQHRDRVVIVVEWVGVAAARQQAWGKAEKEVVKWRDRLAQRKRN